MLTKYIQQHICQVELLKWNTPCENVKFLISNFEHDVLSISKSWLLTEFEVKISKSDFKADFTKSKTPYYQKKNPRMTPNYFYYVCPANLIDIKDIPEYAWLIYVDNEEFWKLKYINTDRHHLRVIKKAPRLHSLKRDKLSMLEKFHRLISERKYFWWKTIFTYHNT